MDKFGGCGVVPRRLRKRRRQLDGRLVVKRLARLGVAGRRLGVGSVEDPAGGVEAPSCPQSA